MAWSPQGDLVATGSNDKTVKLMRYNEVQKQLEGKEIELTMHDGTLRRKSVHGQSKTYFLFYTFK